MVPTPGTMKGCQPMPIYEFFCDPCNTIFNFFAKTVNVTKQPCCPRCNGPLQRQMSLFAHIGKATEESGPEDLPIDESKLEGAIGKLAAEAEHLNEDDPRQAVDLMRKFTEMTGMKLGDGMQEALSRMEAGEDPEKVEAEMGDVLENEEPFSLESKKSKPAKPQPQRDDTLYEL